MKYAAKHESFATKLNSRRNSRKSRQISKIAKKKKSLITIIKCVSFNFY